MKKILFIATAIIGLIACNSTVKAADLTSIIDEEKSYIKTAHGPVKEGGEDLPVLAANIALTKEAKVRGLSLSYTNSDSTRGDIREFRLVSDTTLAEYNKGNNINDVVIPVEKSLFYYNALKDEETFNKTDFTEAKYLIDYIDSDNKIFIEEGKITTEGKVTVTSVKDYTDFEEFFNTVEKKFPDVYLTMGDETCMFMAFRPGYKEDAENYNFDNEIELGGFAYEEGKTIAEYYKDVETRLQKLNIAISDKKEVSKDILSSLKEVKSISTYEQKKDDKVLYAWTFDGTKMTDEDTKLNINLEVNVGTSENAEKIEKLLPSAEEKHLKLDFKHSGALPTGTMVTVNVTSEFKDKEVLDLYYYNPEKNKLELVESNIAVENGYAKFNLAHCSDYVLTPHKETEEDKKGNNAQTGSLNIVAYGVVSMLSLMGITYLVYKNKRG